MTLSLYVVLKTADGWRKVVLQWLVWGNVADELTNRFNYRYAFA